MAIDNIERNSKRQATLPPRTSPTNIGYFYPEHHPSAVMTFGMRNLEPFNENGIPVAWEDMFSNYYQMQMMIVTGGPVGIPFLVGKVLVYFQLQMLLILVTSHHHMSLKIIFI